MYDVVLSGYYGFRNSGDEALLKSIISDLKLVKSDIKIVVLSNDPEFTRRTCGVDSVHRMRLAEVMRILKSSKLLISGGGSLIQDATSTQSILYYLGIIKLAKICKIKVMVYANGVGPVKRKSNRNLTRKVLNNVDYITLRENDSEIELKNMGVTKPEILVTADPALGLLECENAEQLRKSIFGDKTPIAVSVRNWNNCDEKIVSSVCEFAEYFSNKGYDPFLLPMQYSKDSKLCDEISSKCHIPVLPDKYSVEQIAGILSGCAAVVGMRLHAVIYAVAAGAVPVGIVYDPKVEGFMKYVGSENYVDIAEISGKRLIEATEKAMTSQNTVDIEKLRKLAFRNAEIAAELLRK